MQVSQQRSRWRVSAKNSMYLGLSLLFVSIGSGCASTHKTTTTETTVAYPNKAAVGDEKEQNGEAVEESETTTSTTTTEAKAEHHGILSSTVHAIGYVISLPFILVGNLLQAIF